MKTLAITSAIAALAAGPVFAADAAGPAVGQAPTPVAVAPPPLGRWAGPYVGAQLGYGWADTDGGDGDDVVGGFHAGWNGVTDRFVYGAEIDYDFADISFDDDAGDLTGIGRLKLRAGYDLGRSMIYATGGAAYADAEVEGNSGSDWGWTAGAGFGYALNDQTSVGAEVLYHSFDDFDDSGSDLEATTLTARISYRF